NPFLGKEMGHVSNYSEETASAIDAEVKAIVTEAYKKTEKILSDHIDILHRLAAVLFEREKLDADEFIGVIEGTLLPANAAQSEEAADFAAEVAAETAKHEAEQNTENQE
ncbi:MAG: cell division protein FtsH, partial [Clostridia bacterium]|nr:cell division protein FtsH [Clostridia bacterium]